MLGAFTLGEPERVLAELSEALPDDAFARAKERGQTRDVEQITRMLEGDVQVHPRGRIWLVVEDPSRQAEQTVQE